MPKPITTRLLEIYRIGPGPSSSHTVGPMRAAHFFRSALIDAGQRPARIEVDLLGSLSATGHGHGTDRAVLGGLAGHAPEDVDPDALARLPEEVARSGALEWPDGAIAFDASAIRFVPFRDQGPDPLPHPNTLDLRALGADGEVLLAQRWCSVGGGFLRRAEGSELLPVADEPHVPLHPFHDARSLLEQARELGGGLGGVILANEVHANGGDAEIVARELDTIYEAMCACIRRGLARSGELPGGLGMRRRAADLFERVQDGRVDPAYAHVAKAQAYAFAISEENADGGRVVTSPTNGAAGIVPALLHEVAERRSLSREQIHRALATAAAIAMLIKEHASLSGAEVGCQGEVGSATAMGAAMLCELLDGDLERVEYAAEIGMEHNLGLTCDPLKGLVQAPCIERNAMGTAKAWSAAMLALHSDGQHLIPLDRVIQVMRRTGPRHGARVQGDERRRPGRQLAGVLNERAGWTPGQLGLARGALAIAVLLALAGDGLFQPEHVSEEWLADARTRMPLDLLHAATGVLGTLAALLLVRGPVRRIASLVVIACLLGRLVMPPMLPASWLLLVGPLLLCAATPSFRAGADDAPRWRAWLRLALFQRCFLLPIAAVLLLDRPGGLDGRALSRLLAEDGLGLLRGAGIPLSLAVGLTFTGATLLFLSLLAPLRAMRKGVWLLQMSGAFVFFCLIGEACLLLPIALVLLFAWEPRWLAGRHRDEAVVLYYDGACGLCHGGVRLALREAPEDERLRFAPLGGETAGATAGLEASSSTMVWQTAAGHTHTRSAAAVAMLRRLGGLWRVLGALLWLVPRPLRDLGYSGLAAIRGRLVAAPTDACPVVPDAQRSRLLP